MGDVPIGGVTVEVKATLLPLEAGLEQARNKTAQFERDATASMGKVADSSNRAAQRIQASSHTASTAEEQLAAAIAGTGKMSAEAVRELGGLEAVERRVAEASKATTAAADKQKAAYLAQAKAARELQQAEQRRLQFDRASGFAPSTPKSARESADVFNEQAPDKPELSRRNMAASRLNLIRQGSDVFTTAAMGMNPAMIAIQQGPQILDALATSGIKASAAMLGVGGAIAAVAAATIGAVVMLDRYNTGLKEMDNLSKGVGASAGLSAAALDIVAREGAAASMTTVGAARDMEQALMKTGAVGGEVFQGLIGLQKKYANATGQDLKEAQAELAKMFADPAAGADLLAQRFGKLTVAQRDNIKDLAKHGDQVGAQKALLQALGLSIGEVSNSLGGMGGALNTAGAAMSAFFAQMAVGLKTIDEFRKKGPAGVREMIEGAGQAQVKARQEADKARNRQAAVTGTDLARELDPDYQPRKNLAETRAVLERGAAGAKATGQVEAYNAIAASLDKVVRAQSTYISQSEREHQVAVLDAQANEVRSQKQTAATRAKLGEIEAQKTRINLAGRVMSAAEVEQKARDAANTAAARGSRSVDGHAAALAREAAAMEANAAGAVKLADAYLEGDAAAMKAESHRKAETAATGKGIDVEAQARRQLALDMAEQAAAGGKLSATLVAQTDAQIASNQAVDAGTVAAGEAQTLMQQELTIRPLLAAASLAEGETKEALLKVIERLRLAYTSLNAAQLQAEMAAQRTEARNRIEMLDAEAAGINKVNVERDRELAILAKRQELMKRGGQALVDSNDGQAALKDAGDQADAANRLDVTKFMKGSTDAIAGETAALRAQAHAWGMTHEQAAAYLKEQQLLEEATRRGITLNDEQRDAIHNLALGYGQATEAARKLTDAQKAAADAAGWMADEFEGAISDVIWESKSGKEAVAGLLKDYAKARLQSVLTGKGPLAGVMGTDKTAGPGQPNGGILSKIFGQAFGQGGTPDGTANNPLNVKFAGGAADKDSIFGKLFGGGANDNDQNLVEPGKDPIGDLLTGLTDPGRAGDFTSDGNGGNGFLDKLSGIFKENSSGGLVGGLKGALGGILGGLGHSLGGLIGGFFGGGGGGGGLAGQAGNFIAGLFHDGTADAGAGLAGRSVSPSIFLSAPRLHDGLGPDEFPAILERGERVQSKRQVANERHGGAARHIVMNLAVKDYDSFRRSERQVYQGINRRLKRAS